MSQAWGRTGPPHALLVALLIFSSASWALRLSLFRLAGQAEIGALYTLAVTTGGAALALGGALLVTKQLFLPNREKLASFLTCSVIGYVIPISLQITAAPRVSTGVLALIVAMQPIATAVIAIFLRNDSMSRPIAVSLFLGSIAVAIILYPDLAANQFTTATGVLISSLIPITLGGYYNFVSKWWPKGLTSMQVAAAETLLATPMVLVIYALFGASHEQGPREPADFWVLGAIVASIALDTVPYFALLRFTGPVFTSAGNYIMVAAAVLWGYLIFDEIPTGEYWVGFALLCLGIVVLAKNQWRQGS